MLSTRLVFGLSMVAGLLLALWVDEWFAPWFPFWFLLSATALTAAALELIGLLEATSVRPSANSVFGGVLAHASSPTGSRISAERYMPADRVDPPCFYDPGRPLDVLAWPFLASSPC